MKILLVADHDDARSIVSELLAAQGARMKQASSSAKAIGELTLDSAQQARFELVLIDGTMLRHAGFEVAEFVLSGGPQRPPIVMMLSTHDLSNKVARLHAMGIDNYIVKPVRRAELFAAVARSRDGVRGVLRGDRFAPTPVAAETVPPAIVEQPLQILMVDDSKDNRALIRAYLKKSPYHLVEAEDGQQAIDKFIAGKFDLVLMDIQMPIIDGFEATSYHSRLGDRERPPPHAHRRTDGVGDGRSDAAHVGGGMRRARHQAGQKIYPARSNSQRTGTVCAG